MPPASNGTTVVDSSPFIPISLGLIVGAGVEDTKKPIDVVLSDVTEIDREGDGPARTKLRNGGSVSSRPEYEPPAAAMSAAATGPSRLCPTKRYLPGARASMRYSPEARVTLPAINLPVKASSANTCPPKIGFDEPATAVAINLPEIEPMPCDPYRARAPAASSSDNVRWVKAGSPYKPFCAWRGCMVAPMTAECSSPSRCPTSCANVDSRSYVPGVPSLEKGSFGFRAMSASMIAPPESEKTRD